MLRYLCAFQVMLDEMVTPSYFAVSTDSMFDVMLFMCVFQVMLDEMATRYFAVSTDSMLCPFKM